MILKMSFKKENGSDEERWEVGKEREKKGREDERQRKRGRKVKRKFFLKGPTQLQQSKDLSICITLISNYF